MATKTPLAEYVRAQLQRARGRCHVQEFLDVMLPLWVSGAALSIIIAVRAWLGPLLHITGKRLDWTLYLLLGTLFPAIILILAHNMRGDRRGWHVLRMARILLAVGFLAAVALFVVRDDKPYLLVISFAELIVIHSYIKREQENIGPIFMLALTAVVVVTWIGAARLLWWNPEASTPSLAVGHYDAWIFGSDDALIVFVAALGLVMINLFDAPFSRYSGRVAAYFTHETLLNVGSLLILGMASTRTSHVLSRSGGFTHWSAYVGPANSVRQGGWLLWDVLAQYGFLSELSIVAMPLKSTWQSLFILNAASLFLAACFIFFIVRRLRPGVSNCIFALTLAVVPMFLVAGFTPSLIGISSLPSIGPYRFFWCYVLLAILVWDVHRGTRRNARQQTLVLGSVVWLIGTLWSVESASYCSVIWAPAYLLLVLQHERLTLEQRLFSRASLTKVVIWLLLPVALLAVATGIITSYYLIRLGHIPDWRMYWESISDYTTGQLSIVMALNGVACTMLILLCATTALAAIWVAKGWTHPAFPLIIGIWGIFWSTSSYFVGRSAETQVTNLNPLHCAIIALILFALARYRTPERLSLLLRAGLVPVLVVSLTIGVGNFSRARIFLTDPQTGYRAEVRPDGFALDPALAGLFDQAGIHPEDGIAYMDIQQFLLLPPRATGTGANAVLTYYDQGWLPNVPFIPFVTTTPARNAIFIRRYAEQTHRSGWLVQRKAQPYTIFPWFANALSRDFKPDRTLGDQTWELIHFTYIGPNS